MTDKKPTPEVQVIQRLLNEVLVERLSQIAQWGEQNHPSSFGETDRRTCARTADHWKQVNAARVELDVLAWDGILLEEVFEALAESDPLLRRMELLQVAAVALAEIETIDRLLASEDNPYEDDADEVDEEEVEVD